MMQRLGVAAIVISAAVVAFAAQLDPGELGLNRWFAQQILTLHTVPTRLGSETFTAGGALTGAPGWLGMFVTGEIYAHFGSSGIALLNAAGAAAALTILAWAMRAIPQVIALPVLVCVALTTVGGWSSGTLALELPVATAFILLLLRARTAVLWCIPLAILWCNLSALGLVAAGFALVAVIGALVDQRTDTWGLRRSLVVAVGCAGATLCTPGAMALPNDASAYLGIFNDSVDSLISWRPANRQTAFTSGFVPLIVAMCWLGIRSAGGLRETLLAFLAIVLALGNVVLMPIAAVALAPIVATAAARTLGARARSVSAPLTAAVSVVFVMIFFGAAAFAGAFTAPANSLEPLVDAVASSGAHRVFCTFPASCDIVVAQGMPLAVYIDGRVAAYPKSVRAEALKIATVGDGWRRLIARRDVEAVIAPRDLAIVNLLLLTHRWRILATSQSNVAIIRVSSSLTAARRG